MKNVNDIWEKDGYILRPAKKEDAETKDDTSVVDLSLAKHRNGALGHINLVFEKNISRFTNFSNQSEDIYAG